MKMFQLLSIVLALAVGKVLTQDTNCDFAQNVQVGVLYEITSPNYPNFYNRGSQCRWIAVCPSQYNCRLDCTEVNLPQTSGCSMDRLLISRSGDPQLTSADYYCGQGTLTAVSTGQRLSVGLITANNSPGGRFRCGLRAVSSGQVTPPPQPTCTCGVRRLNRIVGGQETGVNEYPMMAGLADLRISEIKCGGVIISNRHVLTAAHCLDGLTTSTLGIVVGEHDTSTGSDTNSARAYAVASFVRHPQFSSNNYDFDIAIVTTAQTIQFGDRVSPVCLPFRYRSTDLTGAKLTILGWGTLFPGGPTSNVLRKVDVDVISQSSCQARVPALTPRQICTYTPGKDACQDDSGGPLLFSDSNGILFSMGIVSFGQFCAQVNQPGVNTRVPVLLDWIEANTPGANYCRK